MSFAAKNLSLAERERIARECFTVANHKGAELHGLCPFHEEKKPSFGYNIEKDTYNCFSCEAKGDLISLWCHGKGLGENGFKAFCEAFNIQFGKKPSEKSKPTSKANPSKGIIPEKDWQKIPPLPESWITRCREMFGWSPDVIKHFDLRLHTSDMAGTRIAIPIRDDRRKLRNIRRYLPNTKATDEKVISWRKGYGSARLFPSPSEWGDSPIYLCEGEKDVLCALSHGLNAVTQTAGVKTWKAEFDKHFDELDVVICYDADEPGQKNAERVAKKLVATAKSVRLLKWPEYMGHTKNHGQDLTDFFVTHKKTLADFQDLLASAVTVQPPDDPAPEIDYRRFFGGKTGRRFLPALLAQGIMEDIKVISDPEKGLVYRWNGKFWEPYEISYLRNKALVMMGLEASSARGADAANIVRDLSILKHGRKMNDQADWICLENGMFNLDTRELTEFDKNYYATYSLDIDYNPQKKYECLRWEVFLFDSLGKDEAVMQEVQKFFGYCLTRETRYEKALILIGPGCDGKSTLLNILQEMVGEKNCSNVSMEALSDQFYRSKLVDKLLNVSTEIESKAFSSDVFKAIVSGDRIGASFKHQTPFDFRPFCKLAFSSNKAPRIRDNSEGFFRKILVIEMNNRFDLSGKIDLFLREKLQEELSGIFAWALKGLDMLRKEGFKKPSAIKGYTMNYKRANNPILCFMEDCLELVKGVETTKKEIYDAYKSYSRQWGYGQSGATYFGRELHNLIPNLGTSRQSFGGRQRCYVGVKLIDGSALDASPPSPYFDNPPPDKERKLPF